MTRSVIAATRNEGKLRELRPLFAGIGVELVDLTTVGLAAELPDEAAVERYATFAGNALAKARFFRAAIGGRACVADDSGLEVHALGGQPGVNSRRWSAVPGLEGAALDQANNDRLVHAMDGVSDRGARFVCAAAYCDADRELVRLGTVVGQISREPRGGHGFGYDPYFIVAELGMTLAEATADEKQRVGHRGVAFRALLLALRGISS